MIGFNVWFCKIIFVEELRMDWVGFIVEFRRELMVFCILVMERSEVGGFRGCQGGFIVFDDGLDRYGDERDGSFQDDFQVYRLGFLGFVIVIGVFI